MLNETQKNDLIYSLLRGFATLMWVGIGFIIGINY